VTRLGCQGCPCRQQRHPLAQRRLLAPLARGLSRRDRTGIEQSWDGARPGAQPDREFVTRWTADGFRSYVGDLQSSVDRQLEACVGEQAREGQDAFVWVTHYERGFWDMAMSG
jgi:hypothetical protein